MNDDAPVRGPWGFDGPSPERRAQARRGNRRRLAVFGITFLVALVAGEGWNLSRPLVYRAEARVQIRLPDAASAAPTAASGADRSKLQLLDSRPLLARVADELTRSGARMSALGADPVQGLQRLLQVQEVAGSEVVQLRAEGTEPWLLVELLERLPALARAELAARQSGEADEQLVQARAELKRLETRAAELRTRLGAIRDRLGVVSEREDNEAVARSRGLTQALNTATEKEAAAAARLKAVTEAGGAGRSSSQVRADPTLAGLEARAHQVREELREMERVYTPQFMAIDPRARGLKTRLAELERQIAEQRTVSQNAATQSAQEDLAAARAQVERLRRELEDARPALRTTSARLSEARVVEEDLAQVEKARRDWLDRVTRLEAVEQRRVAQLTVIEPAVLPSVPIGPDRMRDGLLVLGGAFVLALLAMGTTELFNRAPVEAAPAAPTVVLAPGWDALRAQLPGGGAPLAQLPPTAMPAAALPLEPALLSQPEAAALIAAARGPARFVCAAGLLGLECDELLALRAGDLDAAALQLRVGGPAARSLPVPPWLAATVSADAQPGAPLLCDADGRALTAADVETVIVSAALDAGLPSAAEVTWETLRNTCIDALLGQGLRYSDLPRLVGRVDAARLQAMAARHGAGERRELAGINLLMPALQVDPDAA